MTNKLEMQIFGEGAGRRYTQDSPIMNEIWMAFGQDSYQQLDIIIIPHRMASSGKVATHLNEKLRTFRKSLPTGLSSEIKKRDKASIAHLPGVVAARVYMDELVRLALPMSKWWRKNVLGYQQKLREHAASSTSSLASPYLAFPFSSSSDKQEALRKQLIKDIQRVETMPTTKANSSRDLNWPPPSLIWTVRLIGYIRAVFIKHRKEKGIKDEDFVPPVTTEAIVDAFLTLFNGYQVMTSLEGHNVISDSEIFRVSCNRNAEAAVQRSTVACKADAARLLFDLSCDKIVWGVADSGIDTRHPAFHDWRSSSCRSRVIATYDFTTLRESLSLDASRSDKNNLYNTVLDGLKADDPLFAGTAQATDPEVVAEQAKAEKKHLIKAKKVVKELFNRLENGHDVDWALLLPFVKVDNPDNSPPEFDHGTHVAGIIGADWPIINGQSATREDCKETSHGKSIFDKSVERELTGMCPNIKLIDLRVLRPDQRSDEFEVIAALQLVRYLNTRAGHISVHGVNLSLSIDHDVVNYACGRTPICDECNQLVAAGTVVVASAGNNGYRTFGDQGSGAEPGYHNISITDPGNSAAVITVGATHRYKPHEYGVSYFSSRGPTGDGRTKPDIVAPGEKIVSTVGENSYERKDGTSMSAPHVSGAAALLMARYSELVGQPAKVKDVLCKTATDLGREHYFQGAGMLDVLRALQSI